MPIFKPDRDIVGVLKQTMEYLRKEFPSVEKRADGMIGETTDFFRKRLDEVFGEDETPQKQVALGLLVVSGALFFFEKIAKVAFIEEGEDVLCALCDKQLKSGIGVHDNALDVDIIVHEECAQKSGLFKTGNL